MKTSKDPRHQSRRLAIAYIYAKLSATDSDFSIEDTETIPMMVESLEVKTYDKSLLNSIIHSASQNIEGYKGIIRKNSIDWDISKMHRMDLSILLVATSELIAKQVPSKVVIDEAIELAKEFGSDESSKFVNGILGGIEKSV